jgi:hypothetical protein
MNIQFLTAILLSIGAFATSCAAQTTSSGGATSSGSSTTGIVATGAMTGENSYCQPGAGVEKSEGTPTWGASDGVAEMPTQCINTALTSTPSPGSIINAPDSSSLTSALSTVACGQSIVLTAGQTYTAPSGGFSLPALECDGAHWITIKTNGTIPGEGTRVSPCYANVASEPGYPAYACASPSAQMPKIITVTANNPAIQFQSGANHYRLIGLEITKQADIKPGQLVSLPLDSQTMGANHVVFDRVVIHGQPWTTASGTAAETQGGIGANNSQYIAVIHSWIYDTYCNSGCIDSQDFAASTGVYQDGPFKLYDNLLASGGESWIFGGGGQGINTPNSDNIEIRANHSFKPLVWMIPIETGSIYNNPVVKNLGEFKAGTHIFLEGNIFENNWQGQSDQTGFALLLDPRNQNNKAAINVNFDGTATVSKASGANFMHACGNNPSCRPDDAVNCPPGGCILEINDSTRPDDNTLYRYCNGANGCAQSGDLNTTASLTQAPPSGSNVTTYSCVPGDCPSCRVNNVVVRFNEIYNTTMGLEINTALSSHCKDEAKELAKVEIRDNLLHGLSVEMSNGSDPYTYSSAFVLGNGQIGSIINNVEIGHNDVAIETGAETSGNASMGGLGQQVDYTDAQYLQGFNIHDNVAPAAWHVNHTNGSIVTTGVGGSSGLANVYETDACKQYYPVDGGGVVTSGIASAAVAAHTAFTFSPGLASYMVTKNGCNAALDASTSSGFTLTGSLAAGDAITVRDLNTCNWKFMGNILGTGMAGNLHVKDQSPYPANKDSQNYILDAATFVSIFANWQDRSGGNYAITSPVYQGSASDAAGRPASGKNAGVDLATWNSMIANVKSAVAYPPLSVTTATLPTATHGTAYQSALAASAGASPYKSWWLETDATKCGGNCGSLGSSGLIIGRGGVVNGPFVVLTVSRAGNVSTFTPKQTMIAGSWQVGQIITLAGFANGSGNQANDSSFNGTCTITAVATNNFSCAQSGVDIASHTANSASTVSFAPITPGTYTFWMGARDGGFQLARGAVTVVVN